jgi:hypothetical protein
MHIRYYSGVPLMERQNCFILSVDIEERFSRRRSPIVAQGRERRIRDILHRPLSTQLAHLKLTCGAVYLVLCMERRLFVPFDSVIIQCLLKGVINLE